MNSPFSVGLTLLTAVPDFTQARDGIDAAAVERAGPL
jgi:hypothetical protein